MNGSELFVIYYSYLSYIAPSFNPLIKFNLAENLNWLCSRKIFKPGKRLM
jgi:hypothetical protein